MDAQATKAIREYVKIPADIQTLINLATADLYYGPVSSEAYPEWPGFVTALRVIQNWADDNTCELYVDEFGCVSETEPEWECLDPKTMEPCDPDEDGFWQAPSDYYYFDQKAINRILFGSLAEYF
jgi:hypothetical protein